MHRLILVVAVLAATLLAPSVASADYYIDRREAQSSARDYVRDKYAARGPAAYCRPQGRSKPEPGYIYHRWVCGWYDDDNCGGAVLILGSRDRGYYYGRVLRGVECD